MTRSARWLFSVLFILLGWTLYSGTLHYGWHFDDLSYIVHNPNIQNLHDLKKIFYGKYGVPARFITMYSFALNYHFGQTDVFGYHVVNNAIHIINGLLVWWFVFLLTRTPTVQKQHAAVDLQYVPFLTALVFLVHPLQIEAVTYICQRFTSLATLFYVLALCFYLKGRDVPEKRGAYFSGGAVAAVLAMMNKQIAITLPVAVLLVEVIFFAEIRFKEILKNKRALFFLGGLLVLFLIIPAMYMFNVKEILSFHNTSGSFHGEHINSRTYFLTQMRVIPTYIRLFFFPFGQNLLYDFKISHSLLEPKTFAGFLFLSGLFLLGWKIRRRQPLISFGILWFFLALSVESSFIMIRHVIFEHRCYLPSVGFLLAWVVFLRIVTKNTFKWAVVCLLMVAGFSYLTVERNKVWQDDISLWSDVRAKSPNKTRAFVNLGIAYTEREEYTKALEAFKAGLTMNPQSILCYNNRGILFLKQYLFDLALADFNKAISINPDVAEFYNNRGDVFRFEEHFPEALKDYDHALDLNPKMERTLSNRGVVLTKMGRKKEALESFNQSIAVSPYFAEAHLNRANLYGQLGQYKKAIADYDFVLKYNPHMAEVYNNRGNAYRMLHAFSEALRDYNTAIDLRPNYAQAYNNRGIIYKERNHFALALANYNRAIALNPAYTSAYSNRGNVYQLLRQGQKALADYTKALSLDPRAKIIYYNRALVHAALKEIDLAIGDARRSAALGYGPANKLVQRLQTLK